MNDLVKYKNQKALKEIFEFIEEKAPQIRFIVLLFHPGDPKNSNYICKATRKELVEAASSVANRVQHDLNVGRESPGAFTF